MASKAALAGTDLSGSRWSVRQVAAFLGVSTKTIWRWHQMGRIPSGKQLPGRTVRWDATEIKRWWERQPSAAN